MSSITACSCDSRKLLRTFRCTVCGRDVLKVYGNPALPERVSCPSCGSTYRVKQEGAYPLSHPQISGKALAALTLGASVASALLASVITNAWPTKADPLEVRNVKISAIAGSVTASGFVGLLAAAMGAPTYGKR